MKTLLLLAALTASTQAHALGCWEPLSTSPLGTIHVGEEEILVGSDYTCEIGSIERGTYRAGCLSDDGSGFISVTEGGNQAIIQWNDEAPLTYRLCDVGAM